MDALWFILAFQVVVVGFLIYLIQQLIKLETLWKKQGDKFARNLIEEIVLDEELMEEFLERIVQVVQNTFASSRGVTAKDQKGLDRRIVAGLIDQNPVVSGILDRLGIRDFLTKKPHLVFYILSQYPQILQWFTPQEQGPAQQSFGNNGAITESLIRPPSQ